VRLTNKLVSFFFFQVLQFPLLGGLSIIKIWAIFFS
jgi:hypothetical protein